MPGPTREASTGSKPIIPAGRRLPVAVLGLTALVELVALSAAVVHRAGPIGADQTFGTWTFRALHGHPTLVRDAVDVAGPVPVTVATAAIALILLVLRQWRRAVLAIATPAVAATLTEVVLKPAVHRTLGGGLSFPSGHATGAYAITLVVAALLLGLPGPAVLRWCGAIVVVALGVVVAFCQFVSGNHFPTDTVASGLLVLVVLIALAFLFDAAALQFGTATVAVPGPG